MIKQQTTNKSNIISELQNYMFTSKNIDRYSKHIIHFAGEIVTKPKSSVKNIEHIKNSHNNNTNLINTNDISYSNEVKKNSNEVKKKNDTMYRPKQKDSLFWCFYILKNGFFNYEMEINNQYFVIEKQEKFKYIEILRKKKDLLKLHKIKPFTEIEDDLANKPRISIKTFFALCVFENINILLVNKRKIYELLCTDIDVKHQLNIVHRNNETYEHTIELDPTEDIIKKYRETYFKVSSFDATLKSIGSYKLEELLELCKKLDINIDTTDNKNVVKKKLTKKDIYELLVLNY